MSRIEIIGLRPSSEPCFVCSSCVNMTEMLNEITMDLLLSRKTAQKILEDYKTVVRFLKHEPTLDDLAIHAGHCDSAMVPDDYILHPDKYEYGETIRYEDAKAREEEQRQSRMRQR